jgi:inosine-uridine nucleoside N-ribohydrolase
MHKIISTYKDKVSLLGIAQLTNIALLLRMFPEVKSNISQIVIMGGAIGLGNMQPASEWNIEGDPEAAWVVFNSRLKVVMIPIEVTKEIFNKLENYNTRFGNILIKLLLFFAETYKTVFRMPNPPLHDPCTVAYIIAPEIFITDAC